ncbi:MAG: arylesterase [Pseudomonadota bacterium]
MNNIKIITFFILIFTLGCTSSPEIQLNSLHESSVILAFGDSLTEGVGATSNATYPKILEKLVDINVINSGKSGEITQQGLARLPGVLRTVNPDLVILMHGGNDFLRKQNSQITRENLIHMIEVIQSHGASVILVAVPKPGLFLSDHPLYQQVAESTQIPLVENIMSEILSDSKLKSDQIHPNSKGYKLFAETIAKHLQRYGALGPNSPELD